MARSHRQTPIFGITTSDSEKKDKQIANRLLRRAVRRSILRGEDVMPLLREVSDVWGFDKDGKHYYSTASQKDMRK